MRIRFDWARQDDSVRTGTQYGSFAVVSLPLLRALEHYRAHSRSRDTGVGALVRAMDVQNLVELQWLPGETNPTVYVRESIGTPDQVVALFVVASQAQSL